MMDAIRKRRSIRRFKDIPLSRETVEDVLRAGLLAPSSKNRQPWKFIVVSGGAKEHMRKAMEQGIQREKGTGALLPESRRYLEGAEQTLKVMVQAPVTIFVVNLLAEGIWKPLSPEERIFDICNSQSIGAAIENMGLAAVELGLGSLWVCDTYFAHKELSSWLGGELYAALCLGYADEAPPARPRKDFDEAVEWRES